MRFTLVLTAVWLTACGSIKIRDVNQVELKSIRKFALASFSFLQPHSSLGSFSKEDEEVTNCYKDIATTMKSKMGWQALGLDQMRGNAVYIKVYNDKMKGWQAT